MDKLDSQATSFHRIIGLDAHPDTFTAALLQGQTPAQAITHKIFNQVPMSQLVKWAQKHTLSEDLIVLEASGNSFEVVPTLAKVHRRALVLESATLGKLKEAHANNDTISAVRIGKAFLAGTAKIVWVPDALTQQRRDIFHAYRKATKRTTQIQNRLSSYLSDNGVRLPKGLSLGEDPSVEATIAQAKDWSHHQWLVIEGMLLELDHAQKQRSHWRSFIAQEVLRDPMLLSLVRLCGVRDIIAFSLGAIIGDIERFASPRKLVKYVGLNPAFDHSGQGRWNGGIGGHGRKDLRALLIEAAHAIIRSKHPLAKWGKKLLARKSSLQLVVAAVARKLTMAIWYLMKGRWTPLEEIDGLLNRKVGKIITQMGTQALERMGKKRTQWRQEIFQTLKRGRTYSLHPDIISPPSQPLGDSVPQTP